MWIFLARSTCKISPLPFTWVIDSMATYLMKIIELRLERSIGCHSSEGWRWVVGACDCLEIHVLFLMSRASSLDKHNKGSLEFSGSYRFWGEIWRLCTLFYLAQAPFLIRGKSNGVEGYCWFDGGFFRGIFHHEVPYMHIGPVFGVMATWSTLPFVT